MGTGRDVWGTVSTQLPDYIGGARRDRTADLLHAMQALSQLSYGPTWSRRNLRSVPKLVKRDRADCPTAPHLYDSVCAYGRAARASHRSVATRSYRRRRPVAVALLCQDRSAADRRDRLG